MNIINTTIEYVRDTNTKAIDLIVKNNKLNQFLRSCNDAQADFATSVVSRVNDVFSEGWGGTKNKDKSNGN